MDFLFLLLGKSKGIGKNIFYECLQVLSNDLQCDQVKITFTSLAIENIYISVVEFQVSDSLVD